MTHSTARGWALLTGAIAAEVVATLSLKAALEVPALFVVVGFGYLMAFALLTLVLRTGMALGVAYGVWAAAGVALTAMLSAAIYGEPLTPLMGIGIGLVIAGVLCVELGSHGGRRAPVRDAGAGSEDDGLARGRGATGPGPRSTGPEVA
ncbi:SMR family transporter [Nocardia zapadnayensis]|nr:SMR family transporter [Nocardia zapadnayensis]MCX0278221.1 SMR family transporter [Nocardia zapadnayensis]